MLDNPLEFWYDESRLETRDSGSRFDGAWFSWKFGTSVYRQHPSLKLKIEILCLSHIWGYSSAGRALEWHSRGQRFDPAYLHQKKSRNREISGLFLYLYPKIYRFASFVPECVPELHLKVVDLLRRFATLRSARRVAPRRWL